MDNDLIKQRFSEDEKIVFCSSPEKRIFTKNEKIRFPVSLVLIGGFIAYYIFFTEVDPKIITLTIMVALFYVIYSIGIRTFIKTVNRRNTSYLITDKRICFILTKKDSSIRKFVSYRISDFTYCSVLMNKDNTGSVVFSESRNPEAYQMKAGINWVSYGSGVVPVFFDIVNPNEAKEVYLKLKETVEAASSTADNRSFNKFDE